MILLALLLGATAHATDVTLAGSIALDYRQFFGAPSKTPSLLGIDSIGLEVAQKAIVDVSHGVSVSVKVCAGCHGLEVDQAYAEVHLAEAANLRVGRINVPLGEFNARHDPTNYTPPSKPLPYAMGDMLHYGPEGFNLGIIPTPYSDNGIELFGSLPLGEAAQLDYTLYAVKGLAGTNDFDFAASRRFQDNNHTPGVGGRLVGTAGSFALGASIAAGAYDPSDKQRYLIVGLETYARVGKVVLRGEALARQTELDPAAAGYSFKLIDPWFTKLGWYAQADLEATEWLTLLYRIDGLHRLGVPLPQSELDSSNARILRHTVGGLVRFKGGLMMKAGYEYWTFFGAPYAPAHVARIALVFGY